MPDEEITVTATRFADFIVTDGLGQVARVRQIQRQWDDGYSQSSDYWKRWRSGVEAVHRSGAGRAGLGPLLDITRADRLENYRSAVDGYRRLWGRKTIEFVNSPRSRLWRSGELSVRVNPEWYLLIDGEITTVKLHLKRELPLTQRLADPVLHLLDVTFGPASGGARVALFDVHRGRVYLQRRAIPDIDAVLEMHAAAFVAAWRRLRDGKAA